MSDTNTTPESWLGLLTAPREYEELVLKASNMMDMAMTRLHRTLAAKVRNHCGDGPGPDAVLDEAAMALIDGASISLAAVAATLAVGHPKVTTTAKLGGLMDCLGGGVRTSQGITKKGHPFDVRVKLEWGTPEEATSAPENTVPLGNEPTAH